MALLVKMKSTLLKRVELLLSRADLSWFCAQASKGERVLLRIRKKDDGVFICRKPKGCNFLISEGNLHPLDRTK